MQNAIAKMTSVQRQFLAQMINRDGSAGPMATEETLPFFVPEYAATCVRNTLPLLRPAGLEEANRILELLEEAE